MWYRHLSDTDLEKGQGLVEYALILVLVAVVVIAILSLMGPRIGNIFSSVVAALNRQPSSLPCTITVSSALGGSSYTVPANVLSKTVTSGSGFVWTSTGNNRLRHSSTGSNNLARFDTKVWNTANTTKAVGNCSPFPNK